MNKNGLYQIKQYFWYLYPSKEIAAEIAALWDDIFASAGTTDAASRSVDYWSKRFKCNISYISPETILFPVEIDEKYVKVISTEGVGWIIVTDSAKECFEEVTQ